MKKELKELIIDAENETIQLREKKIREADALNLAAEKAKHKKKKEEEEEAMRKYRENFKIKS